MLTMSGTRLPILLGLAVFVALMFSGIDPYDRTTWLLEVAPVLIAAPIMVATYRRFPLTEMLYTFIALHALVLIEGGAYTYARVPLGFWIQDAFELTRNPYDKIGHFMQGFVPALVTREILLRGGYVTGRRMVAFLSVCVAMAISAFYELIEWWTAIAISTQADDFLGTQGDVWDTQSDMFMAMIGATVAMVFLSKYHDRQISSIKKYCEGL
jgi:putative membrane protein